MSLHSPSRPSEFSAVGFEAPNGVSSRHSEVYNRLLTDRIVVLGSDVNDEIANFIMAQLLYLEGQDASRPIWLYINSPGGSVTSGMAIYDTMQFVQPEVGTICIGLGASMGQFLLCAGAPGKRYSLPHARIMMHQPLGGVRGQATDIAIQAEQMAHTKRMLQERIAHPHRPNRRAGRGRLRPRPLVHRIRSQGLRHHRPRDRQAWRDALTRPARSRTPESRSIRCGL